MSQKYPTKSQFWLLDSVINADYFPIDLLVAPEYELHFNRPSHGMSEPELIRELYELFCEGYLCGLRPTENDTEQIFVPTLQDVEDGLKGWVVFKYLLTSDGGALWERAARPDWQRYLKQYRRAGIGSFASVNLSLVEKCLEMQHALGYEVCPGAQRWQTISPWQATYWKSMPMGHKVEYLYSHGHAEHQDAWRAWCKELSWYTNPYTRRRK